MHSSLQLINACSEWKWIDIYLQVPVEFGLRWKDDMGKSFLLEN